MTANKRDYVSKDKSNAEFLNSEEKQGYYTKTPDKK